MTRVAQSLVTIDLPLPPSVNKAFASAGAGSHLLRKTAAYKQWWREVQEEHGDGAALPIMKHGPYGLWLDLPGGMLGDIDNRVKLASDAVAVGNLGVVANDKWMHALYVQRIAGLAGERCTVTLVTLADWPGYVAMRME